VFAFWVVRSELVKLHRVKIEMSQIEKGKQRIVDEAKGQTIQAFTSEILKALSSLQLKLIVPNFDANPNSTGSDR
jgi:hypothetical protein